MPRGRKKITDEELDKQPTHLLNDEYGFKSDDLCVTLFRKCQVQKEGSLNLGLDFWKVVGYYNNYSDALKACVDKKIQTTNTSFEKMVKVLNTLKSDIEKKFGGLREA